MSIRILIIEDDSASMELMLYLLKSFGYTPIFAFNAEDGLRLATSVSPGLILCDIGLPGMSGATLLRALKQEPALRSVPVVAVTAMAMEGDEAGLLRLGFDGYMSKPIDPDKLQAALEGFLAP
ncbi:response regulator [Massilia sp. PAMC28688]|uniref:response regulator n=1 Tax=Massilia sp. PAMC28688 TaxID=2861283 RepID=UPI001C6358C2|nr:response regulator [Massilia sp. PAMC28688]QYF93693.1 response regulator [Massilia sp. PAMC28688]